MKTSTIEVGELVSTLSAVGVERQLRALPGVHHADVNYVAGKPDENISRKKLTVDAELEKLQRETFDFFLHETNSANGLVLDKTAANWPASIAATGLALACYPVGVERGFMPRAAAVQRTLATLRFFWNSSQGPEPDATGYKGFYYHFLDMQTGRRADWQWAQNQDAAVTHGWKPESGFINYRWEGYDEALLLYILGLGSPTHPLPEQSYTAWAPTYRWEHCYGQEYLYAGSLFTHQLSHVWIDFRGIQDAFMCNKGIDYFENSRRATYVQQQYVIDNPLKFNGYSSHCWGITASEGHGPDTIKVNGIKRQFFDYLARGVPYGPDDGTLAGWWVSLWHFGLNQGPIILMIENYRTSLLWRLTRSCPYIAADCGEQGLMVVGYE